MTITSKSAVRRYMPIVARVLMGLIFLGSGIFGMLMVTGVLPMPVQKPPPPPAAAAFMGGLFAAGYLFPLIKVTEIITGALLLANRFVPLALILIAPVVVNIFGVHAFLLPSGLPVALVLVLLESYLGWAYFASFKALFVPRTQPE